jgi:hypothetical protein
MGFSILLAMLVLTGAVQFQLNGKSRSIGLHSGPERISLRARAVASAN